MSHWQLIIEICLAVSDCFIQDMKRGGTCRSLHGSGWASQAMEYSVYREGRSRAVAQSLKEMYNLQSLPFIIPCSNMTQKVWIDYRITLHSLPGKTDVIYK